MCKCVSVYISEIVTEHSRLKRWKDICEGDVKIFLAHLIAMGLVQKGNMEKYWDHGETVKTPFFGMYMSRNTFQSILSNFQITKFSR